METSFRYRPLKTGSNEVRLLRLHPASSFSAALICDIFHEELTPELTYEALSYIWISSTWSRSITLNGHDLPVTLSLRWANVTQSQLSPRCFEDTWIIVNHSHERAKDNGRLRKGNLEEPLINSLAFTGSSGGSSRNFVSAWSDK